jgi:hypothetical protein
MLAPSFNHVFERVARFTVSEDKCVPAFPHVASRALRLILHPYLIVASDGVGAHWFLACDLELVGRSIGQLILLSRCCDQSISDISWTLTREIRGWYAREAMRMIARCGDRATFRTGRVLLE